MRGYQGAVVVVMNFLKLVEFWEITDVFGCLQASD
jgi:hypothetical protein